MIKSCKIRLIYKEMVLDNIRQPRNDFYQLVSHLLTCLSLIWTACFFQSSVNQISIVNAICCSVRISCSDVISPCSSNLTWLCLSSFPTCVIYFSLMISVRLGGRAAVHADNCLDRIWSEEGNAQRRFFTRLSGVDVWLLVFAETHLHSYISCRVSWVLWKPKFLKSYK